jgi:hypothetical protein
MPTRLSIVGRRLPFLAIRHRFREWLHWRSLVRNAPLLRRCWDVIKNSTDYRPGPFEVDARIIQPAQLYESSLYCQSWFEKPREELGRGATSVAEVTLEYLVKGAPQHRLVETHYVALPSLRYLGKTQAGELGF